jgi:hypothetical protein
MSLIGIIASQNYQVVRRVVMTMFFQALHYFKLDGGGGSSQYSGVQGDRWRSGGGGGSTDFGILL